MNQESLRRVVEEMIDQLQGTVEKPIETKQKIGGGNLDQELEEQMMMTEEEVLLQDQQRVEQEANRQQGEKINSHKDHNLSQKKSTKISIKRRKMKIWYFVLLMMNFVKKKLMFAHCHQPM